LVNEVVLLVLLDVVLEDELLVVLLLAESSKLVSESKADCASVTSPELIALKRLSTSCPRALMPELLELSLLVDVVPDVELVDEVLGIA
jgi:hypothetical protein